LPDIWVRLGDWFGPDTGNAAGANDKPASFFLKFLKCRPIFDLSGKFLPARLYFGKNMPLNFRKKEGWFGRCEASMFSTRR